MPHECTSCGRTFDDGSKEMLSGCPDCGGNKFQFHPGEEDSRAPPAEPPEPPEPPGRSTVAETVGKTAATVRDLVGGGPTAGGGRSGAPEPDTAETDAPAGASASGADSPGVAQTAERDERSGRSPASTEASVEDREDTAQASARSEVVTPDELPSRAPTETEHQFDPVDTSSEADDAASAPASGDVGRGDGAAGASAESQARTASTASAESPASSDAANASADGADRPDLEELRAELNDQFESVKVCRPGEYELNLMGLYDREEYIVALQEDGRYSIQVPEAIGD